ncbi:MAG: F0F1 ATP synthase subunit A [Maricaulaceae bacterium]
MANDPLEQFKIHDVVPLPEAAGLDLSFTNSSFFSVAAAGLVILGLTLATNRLTLVPGRTQSVAELAYEFVADMIRGIVGSEGMAFFPYVFALFSFILVSNLLGMVPFFFTTTSHIAVTATLAVMTIGLVIVVGVAKHGLGFFKLFAPSGLPAPLYALIVPIEIISFLSRPITLSVRLFANMLAGHIMLKVFGGFVVSLGALGAAGVLGAIAPLGAAFFITGLEFLVAFLQAYVFAILTVIYLNDVIHMHH